MFVLKVDTDNEAFNHDDELSRIIRGVSRSLADMPQRRASGIVRDINGNTCGVWDFIPSEEVE